MAGARRPLEIEERQGESGAERVDQRVERLARELAYTINDAGAVEHRERLREVAVGVLREGVATVEREASGEIREVEFNPFAIAIPLGLVGGVMLVLFPPVGLMLFAAAIGSMIWGLAAVLFTRH